MKRMKRKTVWAYLDGKKLVDVVKAALDNNMMVDDMKAILIKENPGHEVTFKCEFTTAEINIEAPITNQISKDVDLDGVVDGLTGAVNEAADIIAEGVHI